MFSRREEPTGRDAWASGPCSSFPSVTVPTTVWLGGALIVADVLVWRLVTASMQEIVEEFVMACTFQDKGRLMLPLCCQVDMDCGT